VAIGEDGVSFPADKEIDQGREYGSELSGLKDGGGGEEGNKAGRRGVQI
jgi:hypothetical protein